MLAMLVYRASPKSKEKIILWVSVTFPMLISLL